MKIIHFRYQVLPMIHLIHMVLNYSVFVIMQNIMVNEGEMKDSIDCSCLLAATFSKERYAAAVNELVTDANTHYHTAIGWGTGFEIIATALIFIVTALTFLLGTASRSDNL